MTDTHIKDCKLLAVGAVEYLRLALTDSFKANNTEVSCSGLTLCQLDAQSYHCKAHGVLEEHIVVLGDSKVMGVEKGLLHGEALACHLLPVIIKLIDVNHHLRPRKGLHVAATSIATCVNNNNTTKKHASQG